MPDDAFKRPRLASRPPLVGAARRRMERRSEVSESDDVVDATSSQTSEDADRTTDQARREARGKAASSSTSVSSRRARPSWQRMFVDLVRPSRAQLVTAVVLCLCAMATVWQIRDRAADQTYSQMRRTELVALLEQLNTNSGQLRTEINELQAAKRELQSGVDSSRVAQKQAQQRLDALSILAGTAPATGPGVTIEIADPQGKVTHELLLDAVEELRDAGAEAIDLNGRRLVGSSWLGSSSQGLVVDGQVISAPFVFTVIGDPQTLEEGARFRGGLVSQAQAPKIGAQVSITRSQSLTITSLYRQSTPQFARPA